MWEYIVEEVTWILYFIQLYACVVSAQKLLVSVKWCCWQKLLASVKWCCWQKLLVSVKWCCWLKLLVSWCCWQKLLVSVTWCCWQKLLASVTWCCWQKNANHCHLCGRCWQRLLASANSCCCQKVASKLVGIQLITFGVDASVHHCVLGMKPRPQLQSKVWYSRITQ